MIYIAHQKNSLERKFAFVLGFNGCDFLPSSGAVLPASIILSV